MSIQTLSLWGAPLGCWPSLHPNPNRRFWFQGEVPLLLDACGMAAQACYPNQGHCCQDSQYCLGTRPSQAELTSPPLRGGAVSAIRHCPTFTTHRGSLHSRAQRFPPCSVSCLFQPHPTCPTALSWRPASTLLMRSPHDKFKLMFWGAAFFKKAILLSLSFLPSSSYTLCPIICFGNPSRG